MMSFLAAADEQRNRQEATAPENNETANMVTMGIERLQQLVQQPPSDYASTDSDKESAMAETDSESSAETRYQTRGQKKTGRVAERGTGAARPQHRQFGPHQDTAADRGPEEESVGSLTSGI